MLMRPTATTEAIVLRADRWADVETGKVDSPGVVVVVGNRIVAINPSEPPAVATDIDLGDVTLLPGLMDMRVDFFIGAPAGSAALPVAMPGVDDDPVHRAHRASVNARKTLLAGFTTVSNVALRAKKGDCLIDVALARAIDQGWAEGPRFIPAGHAIEKGGVRGVDDVRELVRRQISDGAEVLRISPSGGVTPDGACLGSRQYSDDELDALVDDAHRCGKRVVADAIDDDAIEACILSGVDCVEHAFLVTPKTIEMMADCGVFLVSTAGFAEAMTFGRAVSESRRSAFEVSLAAKAMMTKAIDAGVKIACGTDAPAIAHGENAKELVALVSRGMSPMQALSAATLTAAELIGADRELGRLAPGYLADIVAVPGNPRYDITTTQDVCFVMKDGRVHKMPTVAKGQFGTHSGRWATPSSGRLRVVTNAT